MIQIKRNNLNELAKRHYKVLFEKRGYLKKLEEIKENEKNDLKKKFLEYLLENIEDIIMGNPQCLSRVLENMNSSNGYIANKIINNKIVGEQLKKQTDRMEELLEKQKNLMKEKTDGTAMFDVNKELSSIELELKSVNDEIKEGKELLELYEKIKGIFNYDNFTSISKSKNENTRWDAYELVKNLKVEVCPYCNRQFTTTVEPIKGELGRTRPELDHFYSQNRYPFFAVSFFNLIPCCHICNSNLKGSKEFKVETHLHPYNNGLDDLVEFTVKLDEGIDYVNALLHNPQLLSIDLKINEVKKQKYKRADLKSLLYKINNSKKVFKLKTLYNTHTDYVGEIIVKSLLYNNDSIESIYKGFPNLFSNKEDVERLIQSNYVDAEKMDKRVLGKLTKDIVKEFGIKNI
ncbi:hypothetical protein [Bacillus pacificus]|uniref:hypothetical protein n=1 Tax=Bacillus pacificus TaxID=2026187 RepID=UPI0021CE6B7E|nr:hypothetical protein [Bacillus pacificus]MCU5065481.1 hypothetical protein [Bacillus pacificus]